jgi:hypothetical protein
MYRLTVRPVQALVHDFISLNELWHMILVRLHYRSLPVWEDGDGASTVPC